MASDGQTPRSSKTARAPLSKAEAISACKDQHAALLACLTKNRYCIEEDKAFWRCYKEHRGQLQLRPFQWLSDGFARSFSRPDTDTPTDTKEQSP